jgi:hypothetical protein
MCATRWSISELLVRGQALDAPVPFVTWYNIGGHTRKEASMTMTVEEILEQAQQLPPEERARLRAALASADDIARAEQRRKNQAAIDLLRSWREHDEGDEHEGTGETWDEILQAIDDHRYSSRRLFSERQGSDQ